MDFVRSHLGKMHLSEVTFYKIHILGDIWKDVDEGFSLIFSWYRIIDILSSWKVPCFEGPGNPATHLFLNRTRLKTPW